MGREARIRRNNVAFLPMGCSMVSHGRPVAGWQTRYRPRGTLHSPTPRELPNGKFCRELGLLYLLRDLYIYGTGNFVVIVAAERLAFGRFVRLVSLLLR